MVYFPAGGMNGAPGAGAIPGMGYPPPGANGYMPLPNQQGGPIQSGPNGIALTGPVDLIIPKPMPGVPASMLPPVMVRPSQTFGSNAPGPNFNPGFSPIPPPSYQVGGQPYAQSFPISSAPPPFPPSPEIPPPFVTAPWLFYTPPQRPMGPANPNFQNNYYNNYGGGPQPYPYYPGYGYPHPYQPQGPNPYNQQQPPVKTPQPQQTPEPAKAKEETPKPDEPKPEDAKAKESKPKDDLENKDKKPNAATLSDEQVRMLNQQLNDPNATVRSNAAMDLYKILETNPDICNHPTYKPYIDAFMLKILGDPSPLVRQPLLLAFELGYVSNVTDPVRHMLEKLAKGNGLWNKEPEIVKGILPMLNKPKPIEATDAHPAKFEGVEGEEEEPAAGGHHPVKFGEKFNMLSDVSQVNPGKFTSTKSSGQRLNIVSSS